MTFKEIWDSLVKKKPDLKSGDAKVELTSDNLKTLLEQVYDQGERAGRNNQVFRSIFG